MTGDVRDRILGLLSAGPATVARLSAGLGVPGGVVNYELKLLERDGLVRVGTTRLDRGVATPVYVSTEAAAPPPLPVPPPIPGVTWIGDEPYPTPLWTVPHLPGRDAAPGSDAGGARREAGGSSYADARWETPGSEEDEELDPGAAVGLPSSAYTGISFPTRPRRAGVAGGSANDPAGAGHGGGDAGAGREPAVGAGGSGEPAFVPGGSAESAVTAGGSGEPVFIPGGSAGTAVTPGGSGESGVTAGGSTGSAVTAGDSAGSAGGGTSGSGLSAGRGRAVGWSFPADSGDIAARRMPTAGAAPAAVPQPRRFRPPASESPRAPRLHDMRRVPMDAATFYEFAERLDALAREFAGRATPGAPPAELTILLTRPEGDGTSGYGS